MQEREHTATDQQHRTQAPGVAIAGPGTEIVGVEHLTDAEAER